MRIRIILGKFRPWELGNSYRSFALMQATEHDYWVNMPACHAQFRPA